MVAQRYLCALLSTAALFVATASLSALHLGQSSAEVRAELGPPAKEVRYERYFVFVYEGGRKIAFVDDRLADARAVEIGPAPDAATTPDKESQSRVITSDLHDSPPRKEIPDDLIDRFGGMLKALFESGDGSNRSPSRVGPPDLFQNQPPPFYAGIGIVALGFVIAGVAQIIIVMKAFGESAYWGLAVIFVPFAVFVFVMLHWSETKIAFLASFVGVVFLLGGYGIIFEATVPGLLPTR